MSRPGGVNDSHSLNTTETGDKHRLQNHEAMGHLASVKDLTLAPTRPSEDTLSMRDFQYKRDVSPSSSTESNCYILFPFIKVKRVENRDGVANRT